VIDELTIWVGACRYYMGRRTYAVSNFCGLLRREWPKLDERTKQIIRGDVEEGFERDNQARQSGHTFRPLGDDCDRAEWDKVRALWA
jgi:hypothetical protein